MADENDKFWKRAQSDLRRAMGLVPLTPEEAEKECKLTKPAQMPEGDINSIMEFVLSWGEKGGLGSEAPAATGDAEEPAFADAEAMDAELMELVNRNKGEQDQESEELLKKHRSEALGDTPETENKNGDGKDKAGPGGGKDAPRAGN